MAAAAKLAVAPGTRTMPTRRRHRIFTTMLAVLSKSGTPPTTVVSLQHRQEAVLACLWQEVQGAGDWRGLVEPLHPLLCAEMVRYAELVAACYQALDLDPRSKRYLCCKHGKQEMLPAVGMDSAGYDVTRYIYATAPDVPMGLLGRRSCSNQRSRWIGYVAVASDRQAARLGRRDILVCFRGTVTGSEWLANMMITLAPPSFDPADPRPDVRVESGFLSLYTTSDDGSNGSCRNQLLSEVSQLVAKHKQEDISITLAGHSMGSSLALLLGYDLAVLGLNSYPDARPNNDGRIGSSSIPITVYSFAGPRVGNLEFKKRCDELGVKVLRVVNVKDPVTKLPWSYVHVGVEVALDFFEPGDIACVHDLQAYIDRLIIKCCASDSDSDSDSISMLERWQMASIRAADLLQALGIL